MSKELEKAYQRLLKAKEEERKIKLLVLQMLYLDGFMVFDASKSPLSSSVEAQWSYITKGGE